MIESQGPSISPKIKSWCLGRCEGLMADIDILVSELLDTPSNKRAADLQKWTHDYVEDINHGFVKLIRGLINKRRSC